MAFTDAEQAFIDASVPVLHTGERERIAHEEFELASEVAQQAQHELGERAVDVEYIHSLLIAAAEQAGYEADSEVVAGINDARDDILAYRRLVERVGLENLQAQAQAQAAGPVV